ncbi:uncharacterized protein LOC130896476 [Diorhabda carinulata]|uniref:uncharacterized protein LOC130896476 n=1 Tax=Diorhabda carinulata TaxID=1163345 RepID=UPI0025A2B1DB|nr:uncharacterized protein LOC130896476 [Diorhabda carinulata]
MKPNYRNQSNQPYSGASGAYRRAGNSPRGKFSRKRSGPRPPPWADKPRGRYYRSPKKSSSSTSSSKLSGIQLMVALNDYPKLVMTDDQLTLLEDQILEAIDRIEDANFRPQFLDCKRETGSLLVRCNNDSTVSWLKDTVPTLNLWEGVELKIIDSVPTTKDVSKVIVPVNYPLNFFTTEQLDKLQTDILKEIDKIPIGSFMPQFISCIKDRGALKFNCNNLPSSEWLKTTIPTLENWQDVEMLILDPEAIPVRSTLQLWIPGPVEEPDQVLERLERQNKGLNTQDWQILSKSVEEGGQKLFVTVDDSVLDALRKIDFNPFLNFTRVKIKRLGRYKPRQQKNDDKNEGPDTAYIDSKEENEDPMSGDIGEFTAIDEVTGDAETEETTVKKEEN